MGIPIPPGVLVNAERPSRCPMDPFGPATFDAWLELPPSDTRTLEEFAADPYGDRWCLCECGRWVEGSSGYALEECRARTYKRSKKDSEFQRRTLVKLTRSYADALGDYCDHVGKAIGLTIRAPMFAGSNEEPGLSTNVSVRG